MKQHERTKLWFDRFSYRVKLFLPECSALRTLDHDKIDRVIASRRDWGRRIQQAHPGSWSRSWVKSQITEEQVANLHVFCSFLLQDERPRKMVITGNVLYLYSTQPDLLEEAKSLPCFSPQRQYPIEQVILVGQPDTVRLKKANHRYRTYLRHSRVDQQQLAGLRAFLSAQENVRVGPALQSALDMPNTKWLFDYYFVDHDDASMITMLNMILGRSVRSTQPIVEDK